MLVDERNEEASQGYGGLRMQDLRVWLDANPAIGFVGSKLCSGERPWGLEAPGARLVT